MVMMGVHLIDNADLEELAENLPRRGRYQFMFMMAAAGAERRHRLAGNPVAIF